MVEVAGETANGVFEGGDVWIDVEGYVEGAGGGGESGGGGGGIGEDGRGIDAGFEPCAEDGVGRGDAVERVGGIEGDDFT